MPAQAVRAAADMQKTRAQAGEGWKGEQGSLLVVGRRYLIRDLNSEGVQNLSQNSSGINYSSH